MKIIFFDQNCGLCHFWVRTLMRLDRSEKLKFAPIFGITYEQFIPNDFQMNDTVIYFREGKIFSYSDAVIMAVSDLKLIFKVCLLLKLIPKLFRDKVYLMISHNRQQLSCYFEKKEMDKILP